LHEELEHRRLVELYLKPEVSGKAAPPKAAERDALPIPNPPAPLVNKVETSKQLMVHYNQMRGLNERLRDAVKPFRSHLSLEDAGVCSMTRGGLARRMWAAASSSRVSLLADTPCDASVDGLLGKLGAVEVEPRHIGPAALHRMVAEGMDAQAAVNRYSGKRTATVSTMASLFSTSFVPGDPVRGGAVAYMNDAVTQMLLNVLAGILLVGRQRRERAAIVEKALERHCAASLDFSKSPALNEGAALGGEEQQPQEPQEPLPPAIVSESRSQRIHSKWKEILGHWKEWFVPANAVVQAACERLTSAASGVSVPRSEAARHNLLPPRDTYPDYAFRTRQPTLADPTSSSSSIPPRLINPALLYNHSLESACHKECEQWFGEWLRVGKPPPLKSSGGLSPLKGVLPSPSTVVTRADVMAYLNAQLSGLALGEVVGVGSETGVEGMEEEDEEGEEPHGPYSIPPDALAKGVILPLLQENEDTIILPTATHQGTSTYGEGVALGTSTQQSLLESSCLPAAGVKGKASSRGVEGIKQVPPPASPAPKVTTRTRGKSVRDSALRNDRKGREGEEEEEEVEGEEGRKALVELAPLNRSKRGRELMVEDNNDRPGQVRGEDGGDSTVMEERHHVKRVKTAVGEESKNPGKNGVLRAAAPPLLLIPNPAAALAGTLGLSPSPGSLLALAPSICTHRRAASWIRWGLARGSTVSQRSSVWDPESSFAISVSALQRT